MPSALTDALSDSDRATLMGGTLQKVYRWSPREHRLIRPYVFNSASTC